MISSSKLFMIPTTLTFKLRAVGVKKNAVPTMRIVFTPDYMEMSVEVLAPPLGGTRCPVRLLLRYTKYVQTEVEQTESGWVKLTLEAKDKPFVLLDQLARIFPQYKVLFSDLASMIRARYRAERDNHDKT